MEDEEREVRHQLIGGLPSTIATLLVTRCVDYFERVDVTADNLIEEKMHRFVPLRTLNINLQVRWYSPNLLKSVWNKTDIYMLALFPLASARGGDMITVEDGSPS